MSGTGAFAWLVGDWRSIGFVAFSTVLIYLSVVAGVRLSERRTLTEMTAYDFAVAVALGSIIGRTATSAQPSYTQGVAAVAALLGCHRLLSELRVRSPKARRVLDRHPIAIVCDGAEIPGSLQQAHLTTADLEMVLREHGVLRLEDARLVTLESRGAFSVVVTDMGRSSDG